VGRTRRIVVGARRRDVQGIFGLVLVVQPAAGRAEPEPVVRAGRAGGAADVPDHTEIRGPGPKR